MGECSTPWVSQGKYASSRLVGDVQSAWGTGGFLPSHGAGGVTPRTQFGRPAQESRERKSCAYAVEGGKERKMEERDGGAILYSLGFKMDQFGPFGGGRDVRPRSRPSPG